MFKQSADESGFWISIDKSVIYEEEDPLRALMIVCASLFIASDIQQS